MTDTMDGQKLHTITELTREFGISTRTVRFYEDEGMLFPVREGRNRLFPPSQRTRLKLILSGKRLGLSLAEIREINRFIPERALPMLLAIEREARAASVEDKGEMLAQLCVAQMGVGQLDKALATCEELIAFGRQANDNGALAKGLLRKGYIKYAQKELASRLQRRRKTPVPLERFPWLHWDRRLHMTWLDGWLQEHAPKAQVSLRVDVSSSVLRELVASGVGVHHLACHVGDADERLVRVGDVDAKWTRQVWLLHLRELRHQRRLRAFVEHVVGAGVGG